MNRHRIPILIIFILLVGLARPGGTPAEPIDELIDAFQQQYNELIPRPGSSVDTDYPFRQAALGTYYSTIMLGQLHEQNREMLSRTDRMIALFERVTRQNEEIVRLLRDLKAVAPQAPPAVPRMAQ